MAKKKTKKIKLKQSKKNKFQSVDELERKALVFYNQKLFGKAEKLLLRIIEIDPEHCNAHFYLGILRFNRGLYHESLNNFNIVTQENPFDPASRYYAGMAYGMAGEIENAIEQHLFCLKLIDRTSIIPPEHQTDNKRLNPVAVTSKLSFLYSRINKYDEAKVYAQKTIEIDPDDIDANLVLAKIDRNKGQLEKAALRLENLLQSPLYENEGKANIINELGHIYDRLKKYDQAAEKFTEANAIILRTPVARMIDPRPTENIIHQTNSYLQNRKEINVQDVYEPSESDHSAPFFLVGFPRSGTTLTEQLLYKEFGLKVSDEHTVIPYLASALPRLLNRKFDYPGDIDRLTSDEIGLLRKEYWRQMEKRIPGVLQDQDNFLDKLPLNIVGLPFIEKIFPDCKILVAIRDPRDVCISNFSQMYLLNESMVHFLTFRETVKFYSMVMSIWLQIRKTLAVPYFESRYEELVHDQERVLASLGEFVRGDATILRRQENVNADRFISTPSHYDVTQPIYRRSLERWRNYQHIFEDYFKELAPIIKELGYPY